MNTPALAQLLLIPRPKAMRSLDGQWKLPATASIHLSKGAELASAGAVAFHATMAHALGFHWPLVGAAAPTTGAAVRVEVDPAAVKTPQGYLLHIGPRGVKVTAHDPAGAFYALMTLRQLVRQCKGALPCMEIEDAPDFAHRGYMLDISRDKVPTMPSLLRLVDLLAELKFNQLQLYTEHTFAYRNHSVVWKGADPMTPEQIRQLDRYCAQRFIELVPNQNSFGHMERWLKWPQYRDLAESVEGAPLPSGGFWKGPFSICPEDPRCIALLSELYGELLPNFSSKQFNVGLDETFDLGHGRSKAACDRRGVHRVYLDFVRQVHELVHAQGKTMMFWGDIILRQPELIGSLPHGVIALDWGYEADHPFEADATHFAKAGIPFYVCPGTSSWCSLAGRLDNARQNIQSAAAAGMKHHAVGLLLTDWGDYGHLQYLPSSYIPIAQGASSSWNQADPAKDLIPAAGLHLFDDPSQVLANAAADLGNIYKAVGKLVPNASAVFRILVPPAADPEPHKSLTVEGLVNTEQAVGKVLAPLSGFVSQTPEQQLVADELSNAGQMIRLVSQFGRILHEDPAAPARQAFITLARQTTDAHHRLWLSRNRSGGLSDSASRLTRLIDSL